MVAHFWSETSSALGTKRRKGENEDKKEMKTWTRRKVEKVRGEGGLEWRGL